jgi:LacI family transcriptional regulator
VARDSTESITRPARLTDVAAAAGVSVATASRVLAGNGASDQAVTAVRAAVARLDYRPNRAARALRAQTTGLIGMVVPSVANPFFAELIGAVERRLHESELELILAESGDSPLDEKRRLQVLIDRKVDGLMIIPTHHEASAASLTSAQSVPLVQIDRRVDTFAGDYVGVDNALGIELVVSHLRSVGCTTMVFVSGARDSSTGVSRIEAFRIVAGRYEVQQPVAPLLGTYSLEFGREAARTIATSTSLPDAIVCGSDLIALGLVHELLQLGFEVPRDCCVTGFDGILFSEMSHPQLTTVQQPVEPIADEAVRLLKSRIAGSAVTPRKSELAPTLVVRASSARPLSD